MLQVMAVVSRKSNISFCKYGIICQWKTHSLTFFRYSGMYLHSSRKFTNNSNNIILRDTKTMMTEKPAEPECTCRHVKKRQKNLNTNNYYILKAGPDRGCYRNKQLAWKIYKVGIYFLIHIHFSNIW